jgi:hypothetical protein
VRYTAVLPHCGCSAIRGARLGDRGDRFGFQRRVGLGGNIAQGDDADALTLAVGHDQTADLIGLHHVDGVLQFGVLCTGEQLAAHDLTDPGIGGVPVLRQRPNDDIPVGDHADETGWRINGLLGWLWCFTTPAATLFAIERSRASPVVLKFITEQFAGVLVSDFWAAYSILVCAKQKCLVHLLRELERVERYKDTSGDWVRFAKKLRRLMRDAIRLRKRRDETDRAT